MNKNSPFLAATLITFLCLSTAKSEPLPLEQGKLYSFQLVLEKGKEPPYWPENGSVKVVKVYDYPWIEVEYRWMPTGAFESDENGKMKSVKPEPKIFRRYLNMNHVLSFK